MLLLIMHTAVISTIPSLACRIWWKHTASEWVIGRVCQNTNSTWGKTVADDFCDWYSVKYSTASAAFVCFFFCFALILSVMSYCLHLNWFYLLNVGGTGVPKDRCLYGTFFETVICSVLQTTEVKEW